MQVRWTVVLPAGGSDRPQILTAAQAPKHESPPPTAAAVAVAWLGLHLLAQNGTHKNRATWCLHAE
jgi:hypothetical protein